MEGIFDVELLNKIIDTSHKYLLYITISIHFFPISSNVKKYQLYLLRILDLNCRNNGIRTLNLHLAFILE